MRGRTIKTHLETRLRGSRRPCLLRQRQFYFRWQRSVLRLLLRAVSARCKSLSIFARKSKIIALCIDSITFVISLFRHFYDTFISHLYFIYTFSNLLLRYLLVLRLHYYPFNNLFQEINFNFTNYYFVNHCSLISSFLTRNCPAV